MKTKFLLCLLLFAIEGPAQVTLSGNSTTLVSSDNQSVRRAVVIGISDYQDEKIPDLKFAHKDAEAFANFLRSLGGGQLSDDAIKLLLNEDATGGRMIVALDWLIDVSNPGDQAIIYFSGHGDVERVSRFQLGYFLPWDSPSSAYGAGAFSLFYLEAIIKTLSEEGVQVIVISDACRAGKLAGSEFGGTQATAAALSKQYANEVKILSCQPEEFSLEGTQWGGGRGAFSYHLIDALYGMADDNMDGIINLMEASNYLEKKVPTETAPHQQIPFTVGNRTTRLSIVNDEALASWQQQKANTPPDFAAIDSKGMEELMLTKTDTNIQELYQAFTAAIERGNLMYAKDSTMQSANELYELLINEPSITELHGVMTRNFVAELIEEGQQVVNRYLKGDLKIWDKLEELYNGGYAGKLAKQFNRAAELLGKNHYFYPHLKSKALYFESFAVYGLPISYDSIRVLDMKLMKEALALDPNSPHIWLNISVYPSVPFDSLGFYIEILEKIAPNWPVWHSRIGRRYSQRDPEKAVQFFQKAIALDSTFLQPLREIADPLTLLGRQAEAYRYRERAVSVGLKKLEKDTKALARQEWAYLIRALSDLRRYTEAEKVAIKYIEQDSTIDIPWSELGRYVYWPMNRNVEAVKAFKKAISLDSRYHGYWFDLGKSFYLLGNQKEANTCFKKCIKLHLHVAPENYVGWFYTTHGEFSLAESYFKEAIKAAPDLMNIRRNLARLYFFNGKKDQAFRVLEEAIQMVPNDQDTKAVFSLLFYYYQPEAAQTQFKKYGLLPIWECLEQMRKNQYEKADKAWKELQIEYTQWWIQFAKYKYLQMKVRQGEVTVSLQLFEQIIARGDFLNYQLYSTDPELNPIRDTEKYKELMHRYFPEKYK